MLSNSGQTTPAVSRAMQLLCIRTAIPFIVLVVTGWILSGFLPPHHPSDSAEMIANIYRMETNRIRFGLALSFVGFFCFFPFGAGICAQTRKIEGAVPVLTYTQIAACGSASLIFILSWVCFLTAAYRPERAASEIYLLNDLGWMTVILCFVAYSAWCVAIGLAILSDSGTQPIYPRWVGYLNLFVAMSFVPDDMIPFFKSGPFAWNGLIAFWIPVTAFLTWIIVMYVTTTRAIRAEESIPAQAPTGSPSR
jgi:hypothetical protein